MLTRYKEYRDRVHFNGSTKREYVKNKVEQSIQSLINDSQYGFTIVFNGEEKDVAIQSTRTTQEYEAANIIAPLSVGLDKGSLFSWANGSEGTNDWIVLKKMFRPDQPGFNGVAYKCTGVLNWIDEETKELHSQSAYIRSGRITNALGVTPDVNRVFDNLVMHDTDWNMMAATQQNLDLHPEMRFIIKGQAYRVTNVDNVSIDNVSILSLVDDHLLDTDDRINSIAYMREYEYKLQLGVNDNIRLYAGDIKKVPITILKDGIPVQEEYYLESLNEDVVEVDGYNIVGRGVGKGVVNCILKKNNTIVLPIEILVDEEHAKQEKKVYIVGNDYINWNSSEEYKLSNEENVVFDIQAHTNIKYTVETTNNSIIISVKDKYSGQFILTATANDETMQKVITIKTN